MAATTKDWRTRLSESQGLVYAAVRSMGVPEREVEDLVQAANLRLCTAAPRWDPKRAKWTTFVVCYARWGAQDWLRSAGVDGQLGPARLRNGRERVPVWSMDDQPDGERTLAETIEAADPELDRHLDNRDRVARLLNVLSPRQRTVVVARYGLDGGAPMPLRAIGQRIRLTESRASQILSVAMARLRAAARATTSAADRPCAPPAP